MKAAAQFWFLVTVIGLWFFIYYLLAYYVGPALHGGLEAWTYTRLVTGYVPGDTLGNFAVAGHIFIAVILFIFGPFQLVLGTVLTGSGWPKLNPRIQAAAKVLHHWNGRIFMLFVVLTSIAGLFMTWVRGDPQAGVIEHIGTSINAVLIIFFAALALRYAIARDIDTHRRWVLRLFLVVLGAWFIRVGYGLWFLLPSGAVPIKTFSIFISYAQYLIPLAILELYLRTQERAGTRGKFAMAGGLLVATVVMWVGIYSVNQTMWLPRLS